MRCIADSASNRSGRSWPPIRLGASVLGLKQRCVAARCVAPPEEASAPFESMPALAAIAAAQANTTDVNL
jgi:hypothetical protein